MLVAENDQGSVIGTIMAGYDAHRGWLYAVACERALRGHGTALVEEARTRLAALG